MSFSENTNLGVDTRGYLSRLVAIFSIYSHHEDGTKAFGVQFREEVHTTLKISLGFFLPEKMKKLLIRFLTPKL